jgi:uncharacterized Zn finger protein
MRSESPPHAAVPPCPECASAATVLYGNREPAYVRCNACGHVWETGVVPASDDSPDAD